MTPMQQMLLGVGAKKKVYMDDVFSMSVYAGTGSSQSINNGINLSGDGGMVWVKTRGNSNGSRLVDTVRGVTKALESYDTTAEATEANGLTAFNSNGFTVGTQGHYNQSGESQASWSFKRQKGFFDIVTWDGNGTAGRVISHGLGSVPGLIMIKSTTHATSWFTYHGSLGASSYVMLNENNAVATSQSWFMNDTDPTSTGFSLGSSTNVNGSGRSYVAYVFAGGESDSATAKSVFFDGSNDYIQIPTHADLAMGTGDFTIEGWFDTDTIGSTQMIYDGRDGTSANRISIMIDNTNVIRAYVNNVSRDTTTKISRQQWYHVAFTRQGTTSRLFLNGILELTWTDSVDYAAPASNSYIGGIPSGFTNDGKVSNFRIVKGTAVYTSSFQVPTEPLTNITNTKLLCCNGSTATASTVSPTTITDSGAVAKGDSPFADSAAFTFGENEDQGIIKTGLYCGNGGSGGNGPKITLGWEPQFILLKNADSNNSWRLYDSMRGIVTDEDDELYHPDSSGAMYSGNTNETDLTSSGFNMVMNDSGTNSVGSKYIYMAIRRSDGYVNKPIETGTDAFNVVYGNSSTSIPNFPANFPVDMGIYKEPAGSYGWYLHTRLVGGKSLRTDASGGQGTLDGDATFDGSAGWGKFGYDNAKASWLWRRHAGFDVVTYEGNDFPKRFIPHNLSKTPEMIWIKSRTDTVGWFIGHKGLNSGNNPFENQYYMQFDTGDETASGVVWQAEPTSTHFSVGSYSGINGSSKHFVAMLFASISGVSAVGSYTGNGSSTGPTITTGFAPRFILIKGGNVDGSYFVYDTLRGLASGNDQRLQFNTDGNQTAADDLDPSSTGFQIKSTWDQLNNNGSTYIYYAHA